MDNKRRVAIATANRSERGLLDPIIKRLRALKDINFTLYEGSFFDYDGFPPWKLNGKPDVILVPCDRKEMVEVAMECYYDRIPVFHFQAGVGYTGTWDDLNRRVISSYAYIMFCEDEDAKQRLIKSGEEPWRCIVTGPTNLDDLELDESSVPNVPYDLVLVNPNPVDRDDTLITLGNAVQLMDPDKLTFWMAPNQPFFTAIPFGKHAGPPEFPDKNKIILQDTLPRSQFLALLKHADTFISNSSATVYEAPYFGTKVINPGLRNLERPLPKVPRGTASDKIAQILATYPLDPKKLLKKYA